MKTLPVIESHTVYEGKTIRVIEEKVQRTETATYTHVTVKHPGAVVILPQDNDGGLFVLEQYRHSIKGPLFEFPAGTLNPNEIPAHCARRELEEEIGKKASEFHDLGFLYPAPGFCDEKQYLFFAKGLIDGKVNLDEDEILNAKKFTVLEVEEAIREGRIVDAKSIAIFFRAKLKNLL